ncbi:MAG TPA: secretion system protein E, partial [Arthrobacter sp.]
NALGALAGLGPEAVRLQAASALDVVIHVGRTQRGREVLCIGLINDGPEGLTVVPAVGQSGTPGPAWPALADRLGMDPEGAL